MLVEAASRTVAERQAAVLFADVTGSTRLYEAAGDARAVEAIGRCLESLRRVTQACGGRVVKSMGDGVMALFPSADAAADAAARMHGAVDALPPLDSHKLGVRIGFHAGPVIQRDDDVFGDTVNLAARLVEQATKGQVLTSADTVSRLTPALRNATRRLYDIAVRGKAEALPLCELLWRKDAAVTDFPVGQAARRRALLRLRYGAKELVRRRQAESISCGRDAASAVVVAEPKASRQHCTIERRLDSFVLRDHSSNGTYVTVAGLGQETVLRREELVLRGHGWIAFGQPRAQSVEVLEYWCE